MRSKRKSKMTGGETLTKETLEQLAVAFTAKTSSASTPKQFMEDYQTTLELFKEEAEKLPKKPWMA